MSTDDEFLGLARYQQLLVIGGVGAVLMAYGLLSSSAVDAGYDPLAFGIGLVMVAYAVVVFTWDRVRSGLG